jgi:hypothetical protein
MPPAVLPDLNRRFFGENAALSQIRHEQVQAAELEIASEDCE